MIYLVRSHNLLLLQLTELDMALTKARGLRTGRSRRGNPGCVLSLYK